MTEKKGIEKIIKSYYQISLTLHNDSGLQKNSMNVPGNIQVLHPQLTAEIVGIDLSQDWGADQFQWIRKTWQTYPVLRFRNQNLSDEQLMIFSEGFGPLDHRPMGKIQPGEDPKTFSKITVISNIIENGKPLGGLGAKEAEWHTDISYTEEPAMASLLYAIEVPAEGGNTHFCNMYAAYERLPDPLKTGLLGMKLKHNAMHTSVGELRRGYEEIDDPQKVPGAIHPIIRTHPETRKRTLFLGRRRHAYIMGKSVEESEAFLDELWSFAAHEEDQWTQQWQVGDLVLWDNRAVMHRRDAFDPQSRRLMHRTQIHGDRPFE